MHERWLRGGQLLIPYESVTLAAPALSSLSWSDFAADELVYLLNSRSAEILSGALTGLLALATHVPSAVNRSFTGAGSDPWRLKWLLLVAEYCAATSPATLIPIEPLLADLIAQNDLGLRTQVWV